MSTSRLNRTASLATLTKVCIVFFIGIANLGMANIALPTNQKTLGYDERSLQWVLTAYSLTFGGFLMAEGRLGDIFGHRNVLLFGMTLFNITTLVFILVHDMIGLFVGVAAVFTIPSAQSLVALLIQDPEARVKAFGAWVPAVPVAFFGSIFGGVFTSLVLWEWIFWVSLIVEGALEIAAIALLLANNIPDAVSKTTNKWSILHIRLDSLGTFFSISGLILLVYGLTTGNVHGWDKADVIATLVIAVALLAISVFVELKVSSDSILPRYRWGDRIKVLGCAVASRTYAVWQGSN